MLGLWLELVLLLMLGFGLVWLVLLFLLVLVVSWRWRGRGVAWTAVLPGLRCWLLRLGARFCFGLAAMMPNDRSRHLETFTINTIPGRKYYILLFNSFRTQE